MIFVEFLHVLEFVTRTSPGAFSTPASLLRTPITSSSCHPSRKESANARALVSASNSSCRKASSPTRPTPKPTFPANEQAGHRPIKETSNERCLWFLFLLAFEERPRTPSDRRSFRDVVPRPFRPLHACPPQHAPDRLSFLSSDFLRMYSTELLRRSVWYFALASASRVAISYVEHATVGTTSFTTRGLHIHPEDIDRISKDVDLHRDLREVGLETSGPRRAMERLTICCNPRRPRGVEKGVERGGLPRHRFVGVEVGQVLFVPSWLGLTIKLHWTSDGTHAIRLLRS